MSFTIGDVVLAARDVNPAFTPTRHPDAVCWRFLARYAKTLIGKVAQQRPRALVATVTTVTLASFDFAAGTVIPTDVLLLDAEAHRRGAADGDWMHMELLPAGNRFTRGTALPYAWRDGATLILPGTASDWAGFDQFRYRTIAMPSAAAKGDTLPFHDDALDACVCALAKFLAERHASGPDSKGFDVTSYVVNARDSEAAYLDRLTNQGRAEVWAMRRVRS